MPGVLDGGAAAEEARLGDDQASSRMVDERLPEGKVVAFGGARADADLLKGGDDQLGGGGLVVRLQDVEDELRQHQPTLD